MGCQTTWLPFASLPSKAVITGVFSRAGQVKGPVPDTADECSVPWRPSRPSSSSEHDLDNWDRHNSSEGQESCGQQASFCYWCCYKASAEAARAQRGPRRQKARAEKLIRHMTDGSSPLGVGRDVQKEPTIHAASSIHCSCKQTLGPRLKLVTPQSTQFSEVRSHWWPSTRSRALVHLISSSWSSLMPYARWCVGSV